MYRKAHEADLPRVTALWHRTFGDDAAWIEANLRQFVGVANVYLGEEEEGELACILNAVPCVAGGRKGVYLYALATDPARRGRGGMTGLMQYAEDKAREEGARFACLVPASAPLFHYYAKRGYTLESRLRYLQKQISPNLLAAASFDTLTAKAFAAAREKYYGGDSVAFGPAATAALLGDLYADGASTAETAHGYAIYFERGQSLLVAELAAESTPHANLLLQAMRERTGCENAVLTLSAGANVYSGEGKIAPHALFKQLDDTHPTEAPYLRFGFESITEEPLL